MDAFCADEGEGPLDEEDAEAALRGTSLGSPSTAFRCLPAEGHALGSYWLRFSGRSPAAGRPSIPGTCASAALLGDLPSLCQCD